MLRAVFLSCGTAVQMSRSRSVQKSVYYYFQIRFKAGTIEYFVCYTDRKTIFYCQVPARFLVGVYESAI